jgi:hypothetical protein
MQDFFEELQQTSVEPRHAEHVTIAVNINARIVIVSAPEPIIIESKALCRYNRNLRNIFKFSIR